jgi:nucleotide-binding universal stress UspA family protein
LLPRLNRLCIGGALAFTFLKAQGYEVGAAPVDTALLPLAEDSLHRAGKDVEIILPQDFIVVPFEQFRAYEEHGREGPVPEWRHVPAAQLQSADLPVDLGPQTISRIKELFEVARTIFWNGLLGVWEIEPLRIATCEVARCIAERVSPRYQRSLLCGESLARAIRSCNLPVERLRHLTPGGESALQLLAGNPLPAVAALDAAVALVAPSKTHPHRIALPVDGSAHARAVACRLGQLVEAAGAVILLLYVQQPNAFMPEPAWMEPDMKRRYDIERQLEVERIFAAINAALAQQGLASHGQLVTSGDPADEILKFADEIGADLIAMGSHGRTGLRRFLLGSVSRQVLDHAKCPVLIVRLPEQRLGEAGRLETASASQIR